MASLKDPAYVVLIGGMTTMYAIHVLVSAIRCGNVWLLAGIAAATSLLTAALFGVPIVWKWASGAGGVYLWEAQDVITMFVLSAMQVLVLGSPLWLVIPFILKQRRKSQPVAAKVIG